ncbi:MAG TPA: YCF48-related protein, partial [Pyrinomonadaceae bacterium]|nr:YCF48-related protein [Pyrinomonadaceae bacterium]
MNADRRRSLIIAFVLFAPFCGYFSVSAQRIGPGWVWQNPLPQGNQLNAIHFAKDKLTGFAVGADNSILYTRNGGFSWQQQAFSENVSFSSVFTKDAKNAVIVGARGTILTTDNAGELWKAIAVDTRDRLAAVTFVAGNQVGWTVGTYGRILKTLDGGRIWKTQNTGTKEHLSKITALDEKNAVAVGTNGIVL